MWYSTKDAADLLGCSERTIQRRIKRGKIEHRQVPGQGRGGVVYEVNISDNLNDTTQNGPTNDTNCRLMGVVNANAMQSGDLRNTNDRLTTPLCNGLADAKYPKNNEIPPTNDTLPQVAQCTMQTTVQPVVSHVSDCKSNKIDGVGNFVTIETTMQLTTWSKRTIHNKLSSGEIVSEKRKRKNGGYLILIDVNSLPVDAQAKQKSLMAQMNSKAMENLTDWQRNYAFAMETAILTWIKYRETGKRERIRKCDADKRFLDYVEAGTILARESEILNGISVPTLYRNYRKWNAAGRRTATLAPDRKGRRGRKQIKAKEFYALAGTWIKMQPATKASHLHEQLAAAIRAENPKAAIPSYSTFLAYYNKVKETQEKQIAKRQGKKTFDGVMPYVSRRNDALPGDVWQYDGYLLKLMVRNPWLREGLSRPVICYFYDVSTGYIPGWSMSFTERGDVIASAWMDAMRHAPAPRILQPDNPAGIYVEQLVAQDIAKRENRKKYAKLKQRAIGMVAQGHNGIFFDCGLQRIKWVTPGNSKGKMIEPAHNYIFRPFETQPRWADVYVGKSADDRPEKLQRTNKAILADKSMNIPTWDFVKEELGRRIEQWNNTPRDYLQGFTPKQAYEQIVDLSSRMSDDKISYTCLWRVERRTRQGYIKLFDDILYQHPAFTVQKKVTIGYDVNDIRTVRVFDSTGREYSSPALMAQRGSYVDDAVSAEAIKANKLYRRQTMALQNELLQGGADLKRLTEKDLVKLLSNTELDLEQKQLVQSRLNELEKYPTFGRIKKGSAKKRVRVEQIKDTPLPELGHIINADVVVDEAIEDDSWLGDILASGTDAEQVEQPRRRHETDENDELFSQLGIGGK